MAKRFCSMAQELGADVGIHSLNKLKYRGCQGCMTCKTKLDHCVLDDDLKGVLDAVRQGDVLVLASPIYYGDVLSQTKAFIDRTFSYLVPDFHVNPKPSRLQPGKKMVMILAQGDPDEKNYADVYPKYETFFKWYGFEDVRLIRACGVFDAGAVEKRADIMGLVEKTAEELFPRK